MISLHSHSGQYCNHASGTLRQVIQSAIDKGFTVYGLTEHQPRTRHQDLYPDEHNLTIQDLWNAFDAYVKEARLIKNEFKDVITILVGMESEFINESSLKDAIVLKSRYILDYVVGSVHHVNEQPIDYDEGMFIALETETSTEMVFQSYFKSVLLMINTINPEVVGHFDLCRMYRPNFPISDACWGVINECIQSILTHNCLVEINSRAWKKGLENAYPFNDILQIMIEQGVKFTLSDDSHGPDDVGMHYPKLHAYLKTAGITTIYYPSSSDTGTIHNPMHLSL